MRHIVLFSVLLLGGTWAVAQNSARPGQAGSSQTRSSPVSTGSQTTVVGCLSSSEGKYTLTDKEGKTYELAGDTSKLADHVGHEVKITGQAAAEGNSPSSAGSQAGQTGSSQVLEVSSVKHVSKTCKSGGMQH